MTAQIVVLILQPYLFRFRFQYEAKAENFENIEKFLEENKLKYTPVRKLIDKTRQRAIGDWTLLLPFKFTSRKYKSTM